MWGKTHAVRGSECCNPADFRQAARARDIWLGNVERAALEQILKVEPCELAFA
jgi:hypothetical protein